MTADAPFLPPVEAVRRLLAGLERPARLLVAISGGSDSTGLLIALAKCNSPSSGVSLFAATVDHGLRPESADEARAVADLCREIGIPHFIRRWEGEKPATGISAAARDARYRLLIGVADEINADAILTGHTLDDQLETVAMRAARSEGEDNLGLAGMAGAVLLDRRRWLLRPFLETRRADIRTFLDREGRSWIDDPSNLDPHYERVRVRGRLSGEGAPDLARPDLARPDLAHPDLAGPDLAGPDLAGIEQAVRRRTALSDAAARLVRGHLTVSHGVLAHFAAPALKEDAAARRHALSLLAAVLGGRAHAPRGGSMDRVMAVLDGGAPGRITAGRVIFDLRREGLYLFRENRGIVPLHVAPGETAVWDGRYRIVNAGSSDIVVGPTAPDRKQALALFPEAPPAIAMRAAAAMPYLEGPYLEEPRLGCVALPQGGQGRPPRGAGPPPAAGPVLVQPVLAPFDRFLPQFDLSLVEQFAVLLGCDDFPPLPVKDSARKR